ncbi:MAG: hypothetical protein JW934_01390 [Anaerolineae bacterium]|nr:hypothetical protein [Anaerolineae bacterium]
MVQESEILTLLLSIGVWAFIHTNRRALHALPLFRLLMLAYSAFFFAWVLTVLEGFLWPGLLNALEHIGYATGSMLVALWCWRVSIWKGDPT